MFLGAQHIIYHLIIFKSYDLAFNKALLYHLNNESFSHVIQSGCRCPARKFHKDMNITFLFGSIRWNFTFGSHVPLGSSLQGFFIRFWIRELVDAWCVEGWGKGGWEFIFMDVV